MDRYDYGMAGGFFGTLFFIPFIWTFLIGIFAGSWQPFGVFWVCFGLFTSAVAFFIGFKFLGQTIYDRKYGEKKTKWYKKGRGANFL